MATGPTVEWTNFLDSGGFALISVHLAGDGRD